MVKLPYPTVVRRIGRVCHGMDINTKCTLLTGLIIVDSPYFNSLVVLVCHHHLTPYLYTLVAAPVIHEDTLTMFVKLMWDCPLL